MVKDKKTPFFDDDFKVVKEWWGLIFKAAAEDKKSKLPDVIIASLLQGVIESGSGKK